MPTVVSYLRSNAFRPKENGNPGEGEIFNTISLEWEELDVEEKEMLLGYAAGDTTTAGVTADQVQIRLEVEELVADQVVVQEGRQRWR